MVAVKQQKGHFCGVLTWSVGIMLIYVRHEQTD